MFHTYLPYFAPLPLFLFLEAFSQKGFWWIFQRKGVKRVKVIYSSPNLANPYFFGPKVNEFQITKNCFIDYG